MRLLTRRRAGGFAIAALLVGAGGAIARRLGGHSAGHEVSGGILIADTGGYDLHTRIVFGSLFRGIASDVAGSAPAGGRILEVGCGPGHLSVRLARHHGLDVTGIDLDPAMIERARANAERNPTQGSSRGSSSATSRHCRSTMPRSTSSSARSRCTTGPIRRRA